ncbi:MAG: tetratricopeptide repeat protein [Blastocatellia bacterium]|nr:tetratricopeptide repeat protein [Blastocatellia bacterium]
MAGRKSRKGRTPQTSKAPGKPSAPAASNWKWHTAVVCVALLLTAISYSNAVSGEFVYDDDAQIVENTYIQHDQYFYEALTSDVWAFKGDRGGARSNYWRPAFVAWLILNYKLFGLEPAGWHALNILAHLLVTLLAYRVLVALDLRAAICAIATWVFAAHPAHVQSVTWISGVPDVLMSAFLLGSFLGYLALRNRQRWYLWASTLLLYFAALSSKESALAFPAIILFTDWALSRNKGVATRPSAALALRRAAPFLATAAVFMLLRYQVLHILRNLALEAPGIESVFLTLPSMLMFYVWTTVFPFGLGPIYDLRYVNADNLGLTNFLLPLVLLAAIGYGAYRLARRRLAYQHGLIWFLPLLVPVLDARIFVPEMLVQDRYLYLPLLGAFIIIASGLVELTERFRSGDAKMIACSTGLVLALVLAIATRQYNPVWSNSLALWEHGVRVDPTSSMAYGLLGVAYQKAERLSEARQALLRALELRPGLTSAHISMGTIANREGRYDEAEQYLKRVLDQYPDYDVALEQLGLTYQQQGRIDEAIALFDNGRRIIPNKRAVYTINIAVLYKLSDRAADAQRELEGLRPELNSAFEADVLIAWWYLGELYREQGKANEAAEAYARYLRATEGMTDSEVGPIRRFAAQALQRVRATGS